MAGGISEKGTASRITAIAGGINAFLRRSARAYPHPEQSTRIACRKALRWTPPKHRSKFPDARFRRPAPYPGTGREVINKRPPQKLCHRRKPTIPSIGGSVMDKTTIGPHRKRLRDRKREIAQIVRQPALSCQPGRRPSIQLAQSLRLPCCSRLSTDMPGAAPSGRKRDGRRER